MTPEIRPIREDELPAYLEALTTAFQERPNIERIAREIGALWDLDRTRAALDGDRICGTFRSWPTELTVPGGARLAAAAVSAVTVLPTHRRRGILRAMVGSEHGSMRERGETVALLYASEYPIYGRFGYGAACREASWTVDVAATGFHRPIQGTIELVSPDTTSRDAIRNVFDTWRLSQAGEIRRRDHGWDFDLGLREEFWGPGWKGFLALHRDAAGEVDGYARYHVEEKWERRQPRNTLVVDELHALDDPARATLWRFLAEMDWVATIKASRRTPSDPLPWLLTNARAAELGEVGDGLWVRLFDVPQALAARSYERAGRLVLEVIDEESPGGRIRVDLDAGPDGATCRATDRPADLTIHVGALGAVYLGGRRLRDAVLPGGVDEHRPGALGEADDLFRTLDEPWCSTFF